MMKRLSNIDQAMHKWFRRYDGGILSVDYTNSDNFEAIICQSAEDHEDLGFHTYFRTEIGVAGPRSFTLSVYAGSLDFNVAALMTEGGSSLDRSLVSFPLVMAMLQTLAESFNAERAYAFPSLLADHWKPKPYGEPGFPIAWISYVARRATHLVTPPTSALVERRPNGALLMAATDETFDVDNPAHMAVARDIEAAVAPLHGHPWLPEDDVA